MPVVTLPRRLGTALRHPRVFVQIAERGIPRPVALAKQNAPDDGATADQLLALLKKHPQALQEAFVQAFSWERLPLEVRQALAFGDAAGATAALQTAVSEALAVTYQPVFAQVTQTLFSDVAAQQWPAMRTMLEGLQVPSPLPVVMPGDLMTPRALQYLETEGVQRVTRLSQATLDAVRQDLMEGIAQAQPIPQVERRIRQRIGLLPQQERSLAAYEATLADLPEATRTARVERRRQQLLRRRATVIARSETLSSLNAGQYEFWNAVQEASGLDPTALRRVWVITKGSDRTCPRCRPIPGMNPQGVSIQQGMFLTPVGPVLRPPLHVQCRCVTVVRPTALLPRAGG